MSESRRCNRTTRRYELLIEHIRKRPHSPGNPAGLYSGGATPSRVYRTRQGFVSCSCMFHLRQQSWTPMYSSRNCKADTVKRSMFLHIANHACLHVAYKSQSKITANLFTLESKHKCLGRSHARMFVEWQCIQNAAVCFVYTLEESFSKHAIHVLLHLVLTCIRAIPALIQALMAAPFGHVSAGIALILTYTQAVNPYITGINCRDGGGVGAVIATSRSM